MNQLAKTTLQQNPFFSFMSYEHSACSPITSNDVNFALSQTPTKTLLEDALNLCYDKQTVQMCDFSLQQIKNSWKRTLKEIDNIKKTISERLEAVSTTLQKFVQTITEAITKKRSKYIARIIQSPNLFSSSQSVDELNNYLSNRALKSEVSEFISKSMSQMKTLFSETISELGDFAQKAKSIKIEVPVNELLDSFEPELIVFQDQSSLWSPRLKHQDIQIRGKAATVKNSSTYGDVCILGSKPLRNSRHRWTFQVKDFCFKIYIGICLLRCVQKTGFQSFSWGDTDHGHYMIDEGGTVYQHQNAQNTSTFRIEPNDVIQFELAQGVLIATKNFRDCFQINIQPASEGEVYYPCAYLLHEDDSIGFTTFM